MQTKTDEFYIGWQEYAPAGISRHIRLALFTLGLAVALISGLLVMNQSGFATSTFELGQHTELEGVLRLQPVPFLQLFQGRNVQGQAIFQNVLLVGMGKHGALEQLATYSSAEGQALENRQVKLEGTLIYHDGKTIFELAGIKGVTSALPEIAGQQAAQPKGEGTLIGEITDPKCLFGVMKPGFGKPHRSCAARCLAGGIPPVLKTTSGNGQTQYYLLLGENGEMITENAMPYAGDLVFVCGRIEQFGDWFVLYKSPEKDITLVPRKFKDDASIPLCNL